MLRPSPVSSQSGLRTWLCRPPSALALLVLLIGALAVSGAQAQPRIEPVDGMYVGHGYDVETGEMRQQCVVPKKIKPQVLDSPLTEYDFAETSTTEVLRRFLSVDASASYKALAASGSGRASFVNSSTTSSSTVTFAVYQRTKTGEDSIDGEWSLSLAAQRARADPVAFRAMCGTHYVTAIARGAELYATLSNAIKSEQERSDSSAAISLSLQRLEADISATTSLDRMSERGSLAIRGRKAGGSSVLPLTPEQLRAQFATLRGESAKGLSTPISAQLVRYPHSPTEATSKGVALEEAVSLLSGYADAMKSLEALEAEPSAYYIDANISPVITSSIRNEIAKQRFRVTSQMESCRRAKGSVNIKEQCDLSAYKFPRAPSANPIASLYRSSCGGALTPSDLTPSDAEGLPQSAGPDDSMGGQDVVTVETSYQSQDQGSIVQTLRLAVVETRGNGTKFEKTIVRSVWPSSSSPGCVLRSPYADKESPQGTPFPVGQDGGTIVNNYMELSFPGSRFVSGAVCRSNRKEGDAGYVGCSSVRFKPLNISFQHEELVRGNPPQLSVPLWLTP